MNPAPSTSRKAEHGRGGVNPYDLAIIGSGPGGYVAGLYASRHKLKVCVIEKDLVGGTCLNRGCIPTKALLKSASVISSIISASSFGINVEGYKVDFPKIAARKDEVIARLRTGIETLFRASSIDIIRGQARLSAPNKIDITGSGMIEAKDIIIASGSRVMELPNIKIDEKDILSSDGILEIRSIPESIIIIGGGVIGCEFASLFNILGSKVTIVEFMDRILPTLSREISKKMEVIFKKSGVVIFTSVKAESVTREGILNVALSNGTTVRAANVLVAVGRKANTESLGLEEAGVKIEKGKIAVDEYLRTNLKNVYAIGDCIDGPLLAHKASYDGILACDNILGASRRPDYSNVPNCIWTSPQVGTVGFTEEDAKAKYPDVKIAKFPYLASGKAYLDGVTEGYAKIIGDSKGNILGVEILGDEACNLIGEATLARTLGINIKDWSRVVHGHPTLSEILQETSHIFCGTPIHSL